ncbi:MAG TPA: PQQ-dependent sugar dehydrogenase [Stellaceae bacterium]|nr:PQQ-dependent sugar dehydrogenase [Stellaceae bacterium]
MKTRGLLAFALALSWPGLALAQVPTGPMANPGEWQLGGKPLLPLHPFGAVLTGNPAKDLPLDKLKLPPGFKVQVWAEVPNARSLSLGSNGTVWVGNLGGKNVYAVLDRGGKREVKTVLKGLDTPNGVVFSNGTLFVAERTRITRYDGIDGKLDNPPEPKVMVTLPENKPIHFWHFMTMCPDGKLYFNNGSPNNILVPDYLQATILRLDPKTDVLETYAMGVRNSVGMTFHPTTHQLWFTDNARDWLAEDLPSDKLNVATKKGENFGYPFCHQGDTLDPDLGKNHSCAEFVPPAFKIGAHVAPLGLRFYTGTMFPAAYHNALFIARHGSWNRSQKQGYDVVRATIGPKNSVKVEPFLTGFLVDPAKDPPMWGRPADVLVMPDGALLVSDDYNGIIYRISYGK